MTNQTQNHNTFAVIQKDGGLPSLVNQNSDLFYDFMQAGYTVIQSGNKRACNAYIEEYMAECIDYHYVND